MTVTNMVTSLAAAVFCISAAQSAEASALLFKITGTDDATFILDSAPTPDGFFSFDAPYFDNVSGTLSGIPIVFPVVTFYDQDNGGGVTGSEEPGADGILYFDTFGPTIFSGSDTNPTFAPGVFSLDDINGDPADSLTITAVPEPATWAMMLIGIGGLGATMRTARRNAVSVALAA